MPSIELPRSHDPCALLFTEWSEVAAAVIYIIAKALPINVSLKATNSMGQCNLVVDSLGASKTFTESMSRLPGV